MYFVVLVPLVLNLFNVILVCRSHFRAINNSGLGTLLVYTDKLGLCLTNLIYPRSINLVCKWTWKWSLLARWKSKITISRLYWVLPNNSSYWAILMLLKINILLLLFVNCNLIQINIWKIHYKIFSHKAL